MIAIDKIDNLDEEAREIARRFGNVLTMCSQHRQRVLETMQDADNKSMSKLADILIMTNAIPKDKR